MSEVEPIKKEEPAGEAPVSTEKEGIPVAEAQPQVVEQLGKSFWEKMQEQASDFVKREFKGEVRPEKKEKETTKREIAAKTGKFFAAQLLSSTASILGVKWFADAPRWLTQKYFTRQEKRMMDQALGAEKEREEEKWRAAFEKMGLSGKSELTEEDSKKIVEMNEKERDDLVKAYEKELPDLELQVRKATAEKRIRESKYLTELAKESLIAKLNQTLEQYQKDNKALSQDEGEAIARLLDQHIQTRVKGLTVARETVNTLFALALPVAALRGAGYGALALVERGQRLAEKKEAKEQGYTRFVLKDVLWNGFTETMSDLNVLKSSTEAKQLKASRLELGEKIRALEAKEELTEEEEKELVALTEKQSELTKASWLIRGKKSMEGYKALMTLYRFVGIGLPAYAEFEAGGTGAISQQLHQGLEQWQKVFQGEKGVGQTVWDNFIGNISRYKTIYEKYFGQKPPEVSLGVAPSAVIAEAGKPGIGVGPTAAAVEVGKPVMGAGVTAAELRGIKPEALEQMQFQQRAELGKQLEEVTKSLSSEERGRLLKDLKIENLTLADLQRLAGADRKIELSDLQESIAKAKMEIFDEHHKLLTAAGAEVKMDAAGKFHAALEIGRGKNFEALDQAIRRVVYDNIKVGEKFGAMDAARAENMVANIRSLLEGKSVAGFKPEDFKGLMSWDSKTGTFEIKDVNGFLDRFKEISEHANKIITEGSDALAYASQTKEGVLRQMFEQKGIKVQVADITHDPLVLTAQERVFNPLLGKQWLSGQEDPDFFKNFYGGEVSKFRATSVEDVLGLKLESGEHLLAISKTGGAKPDEFILVDRNNHLIKFLGAGKGSVRETLNQAGKEALEFDGKVDRLGTALGFTAYNREQVVGLTVAMEQAGLLPTNDKAIDLLAEHLKYETGGNLSLLQENGVFSRQQLMIAEGLFSARAPSERIQAALATTRQFNWDPGSKYALARVVAEPENAVGLKGVFGPFDTSKTTISFKDGRVVFENFGGKIDGEIDPSKGIVIKTGWFSKKVFEKNDLAGARKFIEENFNLKPEYPPTKGIPVTMEHPSTTHTAAVPEAPPASEKIVGSVQPTEAPAAPIREKVTIERPQPAAAPTAEVVRPAPGHEIVGPEAQKVTESLQGPAITSEQKFEQLKEALKNTGDRINLRYGVVFKGADGELYYRRGLQTSFVRPEKLTPEVLDNITKK